MPKNIVICCDGTGNEVSGNLSNVLKLFRIARKSADQRIFYDPGVGTIGTDNPWSALKQKARAVFGLATGYGLDANILAAYRFLIETHAPGDHIFLFGFSRGAYTVRALAGFVHLIGLLWPDQSNIADYALTAYKRSSTQNQLSIAWDFARVTNTRRVPIHFVGCWDTVASMIVPRPDRFYLPSLRTLPYTSSNPSVRAFRQAIAVDERRRMFRLNKWAPDQDFVENPFADPPAAIPQDAREIWFAGVHADVGGGYPETESGLSKFPLVWLVREAMEHGLLINTQTFRHLALGEGQTGARHDYVAPDATALLHKSLKGLWRLLEILPKRLKWCEWRKGRPAFLGWYLPLGEPRAIPPDAAIDASVDARKAAGIGYDPVNLKGRLAAPAEFSAPASSA